MSEERSLVVEVLMDLRAGYLAAGGNALDLYSQMTSRLVMAAKTSATIGEWATKLMRSLRVMTPGNAFSSALARLEEVIPPEEAEAFLTKIEREHGLYVALVRQEAERRKTAKAETVSRLIEEGEQAEKEEQSA